MLGVMPIRLWAHVLTMSLIIGSDYAILCLVFAIILCFFKLSAIFCPVHDFLLFLTTSHSQPLSQSFDWWVGTVSTSASAEDMASDATCPGCWHASSHSYICHLTRQNTLHQLKTCSLHVQHMQTTNSTKLRGSITTMKIKYKWQIWHRITDYNNYNNSMGSLRECGDCIEVFVATGHSYPHQIQAWFWRAKTR